MVAAASHIFIFHPWWRASWLRYDNCPCCTPRQAANESAICFGGIVLGGRLAALRRNAMPVLGWLRRAFGRSLHRRISSPRFYVLMTVVDMRDGEICVVLLYDSLSSLFFSSVCFTFFPYLIPPAEMRLWCIGESCDGYLRLFLLISRTLKELFVASLSLFPYSIPSAEMRLRC